MMQTQVVSAEFKTILKHRMVFFFWFTLTQGQYQCGVYLNS